VVELPRDAFRVSHDGRRATLEAKDVCLVNSFQFLGPNNVAAKVSLKVRWEATGPAVRRGRGDEVAPTDRAAFLGRIRELIASHPDTRGRGVVELPHAVSAFRLTPR